MRAISKGTEPACLLRARETAVLAGRPVTGGDWALLGTGCSAALRRQLFRDQMGLCAYCCSRLVCNGAGDRLEVPPADKRHPERRGTGIEHWRARTDHGEDTLTWSNLLGVCVGISVGPGPQRESHCDDARGSRPLSLHPGQPDIAKRLRYNKSDGAIVASQPADEAAKRDIKTLNLNASWLKANRLAVIRRLQLKLRQDGSLANLKRLWREATVPVDGRLPEFVSTQQWYLSAKLRERGLTG